MGYFIYLHFASFDSLEIQNYSFCPNTINKDFLDEQEYIYINPFCQNTINKDFLDEQDYIYKILFVRTRLIGIS